MQARMLGIAVLMATLLTLVGCVVPATPAPAAATPLALNVENLTGIWKPQSSGDMLQLNADGTLLWGKTVEALASGKDVVYGRFRLGTEATLMGIRDDSCDTEGRYSVTISRQGDGAVHMLLRATDDPCGGGTRKAKLEAPWVRVEEQ